MLKLTFYSSYKSFQNIVDRYWGPQMICIVKIDNLHVHAHTLYLFICFWIVDNITIITLLLPVTGLQICPYAQLLWLLAVRVLYVLVNACHDTGPSYLKDPWFSRLNSERLAKEQSLHVPTYFIINAIGLTRSGFNYIVRHSACEGISTLPGRGDPYKAMGLI
jgi:hypothetical protein